MYPRSSSSASVWCNVVAIRSSIPLLRFAAGSLQLGIAAEDVFAVTPETWADDLHIAAILGVEPRRHGERRTIRLPTTSSTELTTSSLALTELAGADMAITGLASTDKDRPALCSFQADMPLEVIECEAENIMPMPAGVPTAMWRPVMGFVDISQTIILLLDIPSVVEALLDEYRRRTT